MSFRRIANIVSQLLDIVAQTSDLESFLNGWSQHETALTPVQQTLEQKWYVSLLMTVTR